MRQLQTVNIVMLTVAYHLLGERGGLVGQGLSVVTATHGSVYALASEAVNTSWTFPKSNSLFAQCPDIQSARAAPRDLWEGCYMEMNPCYPSMGREPCSGGVLRLPSKHRAND